MKPGKKVPPPVRDPETGCLLWQVFVHPNGYPDGAHRRAYEEAYGPIPAGYQIDHVWERGCRHKHCIEPTHLEAVTQQENLRRQREAAGLVDRCGKGHLYTAENTIQKKNGSRACRECQREYQRRHYHRRK